MQIVYLFVLSLKLLVVQMSEHNGAAADDAPRVIKSQKAPKFKRKPTKVTFISNPVMVIANDASEFRWIVQELTGKDSDMCSDIWSLNDARTVTELRSSTTEITGAVHDNNGVFQRAHGSRDYAGKDFVSSDISSTVGVSTGDIFMWRDVPESLFEFYPSAFV